MLIGSKWNVHKGSYVPIRMLNAHRFEIERTRRLIRTNELELNLDHIPNTPRDFGIRDPAKTLAHKVQIKDPVSAPQMM